ncbi:ABC transporter permease [Sphingomonas sp. R-74633]|uniref:ABC transporter permease n=1 Tax=Sphingomonas sp. R-74633 TaxID=2751188 RepID=UPI0015D2DFE5|nr:ABC transporter permease [Sphingomonas sp. R-74633]NYT40585.1 ABC transporter permease [Sphingomonas sp. R-74633]
MSSFARTLRQALTVARRDFTATVFTPTFLLFLLAPVLMIGFGTVGGIGAQSIVGDDAGMKMVVIAPPAQAPVLLATDKQLRKLFPKKGDLTPPPLTIETPTGDPAAQARAYFDNEKFDAAAVLFGPLDKPEVLYARRGWSEAQFLSQLAEQTLRAQKLGSTTPLATVTQTVVKRGQASPGGRGQAASIGVFAMFFITLFLSGQAVGTMAEERSNKVIEILAAAVPLESVFFGKLIGMFGAAVLFVLFWATIIINATQLLPAEVAGSFPSLVAAIGAPIYALLFILYFTMAYMLLGAMFLSIGAQTSTQRELQMLSLPITIFQMMMFGLALGAATRPDSWIATAAQVFPFSSPFAMIGMAGSSPAIWPHLLALAWQVLWVAIIITLGARWFRRGVLKSGSPKRKSKIEAAAA